MRSGLLLSFFLGIWLVQPAYGDDPAAVRAAPNHVLFIVGEEVATQPQDAMTIQHLLTAKGLNA